MTIRRPVVPLLVSLLAVGLTFASHGPARAATTWEFPGPDCTQPDGLQACIDKTAPGDTIELTQDPLDSQFGIITHSLTVKPTPGFEPTLGHLKVDDGGSAAPMVVDIEDVSVLSGLPVTFTGGTGHSLVLRHIHVTGSGGPETSSGISLDARVPSSVQVIDSSVVVTNPNEAGIDFATNAPTGLVTLQAIGNRISAPGVADSVEAIAVSSEGSGSVRADIMNNVITDVMSCACGMGTAVTFDATQESRLRANVVGNTIDHLRATDPSAAVSGVGLRIETTGAVSMNAFNNIFADLTGPGFAFENRVPANHPAIHTGYNDYFKLAFDGVIGKQAGTHNLHKNPRFVDAANEDLRLGATSPLVDKGLVCSPGGVANLDAAGHGRLHGASVDLGAYESGAGAPTGIALVGTNGASMLTGTSGDDILCGMGGNDRLDGKAGNDYLDGGSGNDKLTGGTGSDRLFGQGGNDTLCARDGTHGNDHLNGGPGTDGFKADPADVKTNVEHTAAC